MILGTRRRARHEDASRPWDPEYLATRLVQRSSGVCGREIARVCSSSASSRQADAHAGAVNRTAGAVIRTAGAVIRTAGAVIRTAGAVSRTAGNVSRLTAGERDGTEGMLVAGRR
jgi:hypothetical protein